MNVVKGNALDRFAEALAEIGTVAPDDVVRAEQLAHDTGERLDRIALRLGLVSERDLVRAYSHHFGLPSVEATAFPDEPVLADRVNPRFLRHHRVLPLGERDGAQLLAIADPADPFPVQALSFQLGCPVTPAVAVASELEAALERLYHAEPSQPRRDDDGDDDVARLKDLAGEAPVVQLVNRLIARAVELRASDIHLEPQEGALRVRCRIDGELRDEPPVSAHLRAAVVSRIKIMAQLDIAERRLPQDGRIRLPFRGRDIDLRVATLPALTGESVVLRILDRGELALDFAALGFETELERRYLDLLDRPNGILLITGPTGSGKTTTLYASLNHLNRASRKILTVEDPVEYQFDGVVQVQVQPQIGRTFASVLRTFLRQDPNILMVGEVRDGETAQIAIQAALTGRLVLSTLHTNSAAAAIPRLLEMGCEDYLLASTINGIVGQRLVRRLCRHCREPHPMADAVTKRLAPQGETAGARIFRAVGCTHCGGTGFLGRTAILELLPLDGELRRSMLAHCDAEAIERAAVARGMETMYQNGVRQVLEGITTIEEIVQATREG
ncbi:ATPase, T2SS/T4P/T4SS family [Azospirillum sp. Sh1]|uniref:GspE/PulE family protein n=1 Tax=Azospirillum sp. Sh1 TaxID=2607285 RepID=UPI0011ED10D8|nr:ATPase, T2SS/T4P/T4SS family [Azospirillum sp. Sh1]KAA0570269.1 type II secretion system protein GspE [Azospirillum sp. Sh1]